MGEFVRLEVDGGIGTIRLDRPKMNALNVAVQEEIRAAALEATDRLGNVYRRPFEVNTDLWAYPEAR